MMTASRIGYSRITDRGTRASLKTTITTAIAIAPRTAAIRIRRRSGRLA